MMGWWLRWHAYFVLRAISWPGGIFSHRRVFRTILIASYRRLTTWLIAGSRVRASPISVLLLLTITRSKITAEAGQSRIEDEHRCILPLLLIKHWLQAFSPDDLSLTGDTVAVDARLSITEHCRHAVCCTPGTFLAIFSFQSLHFSRFLNTLYFIITTLKQKSQSSYFMLAIIDLLPLILRATMTILI